MRTSVSQTTYRWDAAHNRTQNVKDDVTSNYGYSGFNQLTGFSEPGRQVSLAYDENGNRIRCTGNGAICVTVPVVPPPKPQERQ